MATILSAQCTDVKVNQVTQKLFKKYRSAKSYAGADLAELEEDIRPTGFHVVGPYTGDGRRVGGTNVLTGRAKLLWKVNDSVDAPAAMLQFAASAGSTV